MLESWRRPDEWGEAEAHAKLRAVCPPNLVDELVAKAPQRDGTDRHANALRYLARRIAAGHPPDSALRLLLAGVPDQFADGGVHGAGADVALGLRRLGAEVRALAQRDAGRVRASINWIAQRAGWR